jgi:hypothetical protein
MVTAKEELVAASIRKQIAYLEGLLNELETEPLKDQNISRRIQEVETRIRTLRNQLS